MSERGKDGWLVDGDSADYQCHGISATADILRVRGLDVVIESGSAWDYQQCEVTVPWHVIEVLMRRAGYRVERAELQHDPISGEPEGE